MGSKVYFACELEFANSYRKLLRFPKSNHFLYKESVLLFALTLVVIPSF